VVFPYTQIEPQKFYTQEYGLLGLKNCSVAQYKRAEEQLHPILKVRQHFPQEVVKFESKYYFLWTTAIVGPRPPDCSGF